ncbi:GAF and ANTAR domain-containing protein [Cellulomonas sp. URHD0024]|uniref:GAF and ANTAR domain-containing protein n=1 Tax=Cellulomonas sp. URHD0024 TaxID=1302620 RepID=UPI00041856AD|nr:GAF and ANTAR domain-containing protein [Cellulomonas sp. URHD0024]
MDEATRTAAITELQAVLLETVGIEEFLDGVADAAARQVGPATSATITLRRDGRPTLVAASDPRAAECDEVEYAVEEGPCLSSIDLGRLIHVPDIATETQWPAWRAAARGNGYRSAAALPRSVRPATHIALNLYAVDAHAWNESAIEVADLYADEAARAVALCLRTADLAEMNADLRAALASRAVIDQALGVVMAQNRCSPDKAMAILRSASQHRKVKLREVAAIVVEAVAGTPARTVDTFQQRN